MRPEQIITNYYNVFNMLRQDRNLHGFYKRYWPDVCKDLTVKYKGAKLSGRYMKGTVVKFECLSWGSAFVCIILHKGQEISIYAEDAVFE